MCLYPTGSARIHRRRKKQQQQVQNPYNRKLRERVKERDDWMCVTCGATDNLTIHHKDGNHKNNELTNLVTLCKECHEKIHTRKKKTKRDRTRLKQDLKELIFNITGIPDTEIQTALRDFTELHQTSMEIVGVITATE